MARTFDIYDLNSPMVAPSMSFVAPADTTTVQDAVTDGRSYWQRLADDRLFNGSIVLLVFACVEYLISTILSGFPLGWLIGVEGLALVVVLVLAGVITAFLVATVMAVRQ